MAGKLRKKVKQFAAGTGKSKRIAVYTSDKGKREVKKDPRVTNFEATWEKGDTNRIVLSPDESKPLSPAAKFKARIIEETIDNYERAHSLGKYKSVQSNFTMSAPTMPTLTELETAAIDLNGRLYDGLLVTSKEGVRQDFELAIHHVKIATRYFTKATKI